MEFEDGSVSPGSTSVPMACCCIRSFNRTGAALLELIQLFFCFEEILCRIDLFEVLERLLERRFRFAIFSPFLLQQSVLVVCFAEIQRVAVQFVQSQAGPEIEIRDVEFFHLAMDHAFDLVAIRYTQLVIQFAEYAERFMIQYRGKLEVPRSGKQCGFPEIGKRFERFIVDIFGTVQALVEFLFVDGF